MFTPFRLITHLLFIDKSSFKFVIGIILGLAFSITTILGTIGILDAFTFTLRRALKNSNGDISIRARYGFYQFDQEMEASLKKMNIKSYSNMIKSQGFAINDEISKGVMILGIDKDSYKNVSGLNINISDEEVAIGKELANRLEIKSGEDIVLGIANGNSEIAGLPQLKRFKVGQIIEHAIFQKDSRMFYLSRSVLSKMMNISSDKYNGMIITLPNIEKYITQENDERIKEAVYEIRKELGYDYIVRPYWQEFSAFLKAIRAEKFMISLILQLIVIISVINVLAFIIFLNEKRSREIFLFKALGMSQKRFVTLWLSMVTAFWAISCIVSIFMVEGLKVFLNNFTYFEKLIEIYNLGRLSILLEPGDYILVFGLALVWVLGIAWWGLRRLKRKSLLDGLRKEFA